MENPIQRDEELKNDPVREFASGMMLIPMGLFFVITGVFLIVNANSNWSVMGIVREIWLLLNFEEKWLAYSLGVIFVLVGTVLVTIPIRRWKQNA